MEFPQLQKLIKQYPEHKELIKKTAIALIGDYYAPKRTQCDICDKKLTTEEMESVGLTDFNNTCNEHRKYATMFRHDVIRQEIGLPTYDKSVEQEIQEL